MCGISQREAIKIPEQYVEISKRTHEVFLTLRIETLQKYSNFFPTLQLVKPNEQHTLF